MIKRMMHTKQWACSLCVLVSHLYPFVRWNVDRLGSVLLM